MQFCVGTPPGIPGRRRSTSGSSCGGTSPPQYGGAPWPLMNSPLRRGGPSHYPATVSATPLMAPIKGSPTKGSVLANVSETATTPFTVGAGGGGMVQWRNAGGAEWNHHPARTMTLPEFGSKLLASCDDGLGKMCVSVTVSFFELASPSVTMCGTNPNHGFHRSQTDILVPSSPVGGSRSPIHGYAGGLQSSNGSTWSLQRKASFDQQMLGYSTSPPMEGPIVFVAPELTQETLLEVFCLHSSLSLLARLSRLTFITFICLRRRSITTRWPNSTLCWLWSSALSRWHATGRRPWPPP